MDKLLSRKTFCFYVLTGVMLLGCNPVDIGPREVVSSTLPATLLWQSEVDGPVMQSALLTETAVIVVTVNNIYALDRTDGRQLWKHAYKGDTYALPIETIHDIVVYGDKEGRVTALKLLTGDTEWQQTIAGKEKFSRINYRINSIITAQDTIYAASQPTAIEAFDYQSGESKWLTLGTENGIPSRGARLLLSEDSLYVYTEEVHTLNRETGEIVDAFERNLPRGWNDIQLDDQKIYTVQSLWDANTLALLETLTSPSYMPLVGRCEEFIQPYVINEYTFYGAGMCGGVFEMKANGEEYVIGWEYLLDSRATTPLAMSEKYLYTLYSNGQLHAIDFTSGESAGILKTSLTTGSIRAAGSGVVNEGSFIVATFADTNIWAFCETPCP